MFVATNRIKIAKGNGADLERRFGPRGGVEQEPGFLGFELWKQHTGGDHEEYLVVTHWESEDAHIHWVRSESFQRAHADMRIDYILGPGEISNYDVRLSSAPATE